jgi:hypothetical protein
MGMMILCQEECSKLSKDDLQKLDLFTDREKLTRKIINYLYDDNMLGKILYFYGDGGNGKSLLLKYFKRNFCRKLKNNRDWELCRSKSDKELQLHLTTLDSENFTLLPYSFIDFGQKASPRLQPQDPYSVLMEMHRQLVRHKISFPLYEYGCICYLRKTGLLTKDRLVDLFPEKEVGLAIVITREVIERGFDIITGGTTLILNAALGVLNQHAKEWWNIHRLQSKCC